MLKLVDTTRSALYANSATQAGTALLQLMGLPVLLLFWGKEYYGAWVLIVGFAANSSFLDFGILQSCANNIIILQSSGLKSKAKSWYLLGLRFSIYFLVFFVLIFSVVFFWVSDYIGSLFGQGVDGHTFSFFLLLYIWLLLLFNAATSFVRAMGGNATAAWLSFIGITLDGLCPIVSASCGFGPNVAIFAMALSRLITSIFSLIIIPGSSYFPSENTPLEKISIYSVIKPAAANLIIQAWSVLSLQAILVMISIFSGVKEVGLFSAVRTLSRLPFQIHYVIIRSLQNQGIRLYSAGIIHSLKLLLHKIYISFLFVFVCAVLFLILGKYFLTFWSSGRFEVNALYLLPFSLVLVFHTVWQSALAFLSGLNRQFEFSVILLACGLVFIFVAYFSAVYALLIWLWVVFEFLMMLASIFYFRKIFIGL